MPSLVSLLRPLHQHRRSFIAARVKWIRDGRLDRAVESQKHLRPLLDLKDQLLLLHPRPVPASTLHHVPLPLHLSRFLPLYPSLFSSSHSPTALLLRLHRLELRLHSSLLPHHSRRLLRLLLLSRLRRIPLPLILRLRFPLGLPHLFPRSLLPLFPDLFHLVPSLSSHPQLDLAALRHPDPLPPALQSRQFPMILPRGFDLRKKVRNWTEDLYHLPYVSPYEDMTHLDWGSPIAEKWVVAVLREILHVTVSKMLEMEDLIAVAEHAGIVEGARKTVLRYPGIFYLCNKLGVQTVVLKEAFRKDLLVQKHPIVRLRYRYMRIMKRDLEGRGCADEDEEDEELEFEDLLGKGKCVESNFCNVDNKIEECVSWCSL